MAERKSTRSTRTQGDSMNGIDEEQDTRGSRRSTEMNIVDPIDRIVQVYQFLRSPQVELTIKRFVASRKARQVINASISVLEVVVVLLPLLRKLGGRVNDLVALLKRPSRPQQVRGGQGRRSQASLPAHSVH
jgi:hypothetical protein